MNDSEIQYEEKLRACAMLKALQNENEEKLAHVHSLFSNQMNNYMPTDNHNYRDHINSTIYSNSNTNSYINKNLSGLFMRTILAIVCSFILFASNNESTSRSINNYTNNRLFTKSQREELNQFCVSLLEEDETDYIFDFISKLPYTLSYEKINVKR